MIASEFPELLLSLTLQCTVILLTVRWLAGFARSSDIADRLWGHAHLSVLLLSCIGFFLPHIRLLQPQSVMQTVTTVAGLEGFEKFALLLLVTWMFGAAVLICRTFWSLFSTSRLVGRATTFPLPAFHPREMPALQETVRRLNILRVRVLLSEDCVSPFCWQLQSPVIVLPEFLTTFPAPELNAVLLHEMAHLQARHPLSLFLQRLVEILFWFHPFVWITSREASLQRELASDRIAIGSVAEAAAFLKGMVRLAERHSPDSFELAAGLSFDGHGSSTIQRRTEQLLSRNWSEKTSAQRWSWHAVALATITISATSLWIPLNAQTMGRTLFSPWPEVTAAALHELGFSVRDYEVDTHRLERHVHHESADSQK